MLDDAFISFRYAENLAAGNGPVFNVGERVEGYTTFLWVVLLSLGKLIGQDLVYFSRILGSIFAAVVLFLLFLSNRFNSQIDRPAAAIAVIFLGTCGVFAPWAISGMEVTLYTSLLLAAVLLHIREPGGAGQTGQAVMVGIVCAVAALTRPEGLMLFGILWLDQLLRSLRGRDRSAYYMLGVFLLPYIPYFCWRFSYYGYPLPNSFYAKVGSTGAQVLRGLDYTSGFAWVALPLLLLALPQLFSPAWWRRHERLRVIPVLCLAVICYTTMVGGDFMPAYRFFAPILPMICLLAALQVRSIPNSAVAAALVLVAVTFNIFQIRSGSDVGEWLHRNYIAWRGKEAGLWLRYNAPPDAVVATNTAGSVPYFSGLTAIDMLGVNDSHIAHRQVESMGSGKPGHEKSDGDYVLARRPDFIIFGAAEGSFDPIFRSDLELSGNFDFIQLYRFRNHPLPSGRRLQLWELRDRKR